MKMDKMQAIYRDTKVLIERGIIPEKLGTSSNLKSFMLIYNQLVIENKVQFSIKAIADYFSAYGFIVTEKNGVFSIIK